MKPQRFEIGQAITPKDKDGFVREDPAEADPLLKFGEVYHVKAYRYLHKIYNCWIITLDGLPYEYDEEGFDPVIETNELEKEIEEIFAPLYELV